MIPPPCHKGRQDACFPAFAGKGRRMWRLRLPHVVMKRYRRFPIPKLIVLHPTERTETGGTVPRGPGGNVEDRRRTGTRPSLPEAVAVPARGSAMRQRLVQLLDRRAQRLRQRKDCQPEQRQRQWQQPGQRRPSGRVSPLRVTLASAPSFIDTDACGQHGLPNNRHPQAEKMNATARNAHGTAFCAGCGTGRAPLCRSSC